MPQEILGILVLVGVSTIIGAVYFSGLGQIKKPFDADMAVSRILIDFPDLAATKVIFDDARKSAFIFQYEGAPVGLVWKFGNKFVTRLLSAETVHNYKFSGSQLSLNMKESFFGNAAFKFNNDNDITFIQDKFSIVLTSAES